MPCSLAMPSSSVGSSMDQPHMEEQRCYGIQTTVIIIKQGLPSIAMMMTLLQPNAATPTRGPKPIVPRSRHPNPPQLNPTSTRSPDAGTPASSIFASFRASPGTTPTGLRSWTVPRPHRITVFYYFSLASRRFQTFSVSDARGEELASRVEP
ncbi:hypothetical protein P152DRAFT_138543 [Eremomyces bilateralis CBS 781.70]|uniref:Uncharacterized protein n=1 Tax=Eremomyces bilateralis CBS 781.70 TaxID=1392243 RepID=A0A6G1FW36_9PEZI|nr:uncharacterized protein P152DRAFT_138543 [Eremomyces bilateralis CBS 781.70]KAF1810047.1 hypothetical protein P152DRAFT_138543 [Eremomyces bilateralis CBS 781.70]